jgi:hypothetical protein
MSYYRLYFLDGFDRRITGFDEFEAATDFGALAMAEDRRRIAAMELWCEGRKVRHWDALATETSARLSGAWRAQRA